MKIRTILDHIELGSIAQPEFQRGYVWNRDQVRDLMHSLYRRYPVGSLLVWATRYDTRGWVVQSEFTVRSLESTGTLHQDIDVGVIRVCRQCFLEGSADVTD